MANTIDPGQPLHNPRPNAPVAPAQETQPGAAEKERGPITPAAQNYIQQAKQDVTDIRQLGAPKKP